MGICMLKGGRASLHSPLVDAEAVGHPLPPPNPGRRPEDFPLQKAEWKK